MPDIVIDTNVLKHANNTKEHRQKHAIELITYLLSSNEFICLDEGFSLNESLNKSHIGNEYITHLKVGMLGYSFLVKIALEKRIKEVPKSTELAISKVINQKIRNLKDRVFLKVTNNAAGKTLISHDFTDISLTKRDFFRENLTIVVIEASEYP